jgi:hypothetical protein
MKRGFEPKASLSPEDKLKAAYLHEIVGLDYQTLTIIFGVNPGRIADAIKGIREAIGLYYVDEEEIDA